MDCCKIPDYVQEKLEEVRKESRVQKLNEVLRVAVELSRSGWKEDEVVEKLYPEFNRVKKLQGQKLRCRLKKIAECLTRKLKGLNYSFPPPDTFCSLHMWITKDASARQQTMQKRPRLKQTTIRQFSVEISSSASQCSNTSTSYGSDEDVATDLSQIGSHSSSPSSPVSKRMKLVDQIIEDLAVNTPVPARESTPLREFPVESPSVSESPRVIADELVVHYDSHDAEVTVNLLAVLTSTFIDWSVISQIFSYLIIHALKLRASRLKAFYNEKCSQAGRRIENIEPMMQSKNNTLREDTATVSDILAKFEPSYQTLLDVFHRHLTLSEELPLLQEVSFVINVPITVRWDIPSSLSPIERMKCKGEWIYFQSCMEACRTQIQQAPFSLETMEMLQEIPKLIKDKSPVVLEHPQVRDWLDGVHRLVEAIHSRNDRKAEVKVTVKKLRDYDRKSREALDEIKSKFTELSKCDHQVGILRARSETRIKALCLKSQLMREQRDRLLKEVHDLNVKIAQEESDTTQEYTFQVEKCVVPWSFSQVMNLLEPIVLNLTRFVQQEFSSENLENVLKERVDGNIRLLGRMVCNSRAVEASTMVAGESEHCDMVS